MNELGKPSGPRSKGCKHWMKQFGFSYMDAEHGNDKGWTDEDWDEFRVRSSPKMKQKGDKRKVNERNP
jgi:hypothetical protein